MMVSSRLADRCAALLRQLTAHDAGHSPTRHDWEQWLLDARSAGAVPLLDRLVQREPTDITEAQFDDLRALLDVVMAHCVTLEHHLLTITERFSAVGIASVALKGSAVAHLDHEDPSLRQYADLDLLVRPADRGHAGDVLKRAGWNRRYPVAEAHGPFAHAFTYELDGAEVDLHQRLARRGLGLLLAPDALVDRAQPFEIAGRSVLGLDDIDRLLHSAIHATHTRSRGRRISSLSDILVVTHNRPDLAELVVDRAAEHQLRHIVEFGLTLAHDAARLPLPTPWAEALQASREPRRLLDRAYTHDKARPVLEEVAHLQLLDSWSDRARYLAGFFGSDDDVASHQRGLRYVLGKAFTRRRTRAE